MKISFSGPYNQSSKKFKYYTLIPTIDFIIDRQMDDLLYTQDNEHIGGIIEYNLGFHWLIFSFYINIELTIKNKL